jgi:hypothetical protein
MLKKHMFPLSKKGTLHAHKGKGSQQVPMPSRHEVQSLARGPMNSINDYSKATPMPQSSQPAGPMPPPFDMEG